jgi:hypothetical protein
MTSLRTLHGSLVSLAVTATLFTACGIPMQVSPVPLATPNISSPSPTSSGTTIPTPDLSLKPVGSGTKLWFVRFGELAPTNSDLDLGSSAEQILAALFDGPVAHGGKDTDRTLNKDPSTGAPLLTVGLPTLDEQEPTDSTTDLSIANVALFDAFFALPAVDQSLLLGQAVMSLTSGGFRSVIFTDTMGGTLAVPLPNGRLLTGPVLRTDFDSLIAIE